MPPIPNKCAKRIVAFAAIVAICNSAADAAEEKSIAPQRGDELTTAPAAVANSASGMLNQVGISPKFGTRLPLELQFADATGKQVTLRDCFTERPVILHLVYYECPMLCKLSADGLFKTLSTLNLKPGHDFTIVTLSIDPHEDAALAHRARDLAAERCGQATVDTGWHFLTGQQNAISAVTNAVGFRYAFNERTGQFAHAAGLFVLTPDGVVSRYLSGIEYSPRDLRLALVEAGNGKVGTATDQALLLCYMYDPTTGKYGLAIVTLLRTAGAATVLGLATAIFTMIRRERIRSRSGFPA